MKDLITRKEALSQGKSRYFTGKPCIQGHTDERNVNNGSCCECIRIRQRVQNKKYDRLRVKTKASTRGETGFTRTAPEKIAMRRNRFNQNNPDVVRGYSKRHYQKDKDKVNTRSKSNRLMRNIGISIDDYQAIMEKHDGRCDICGTAEPGGPHGKFNLDHCHSTGTLRGILCRRCNTSIGQFEDSVELLESAIRYLKKPPRTHEMETLVEIRGLIG